MGCGASYVAPSFEETNQWPVGLPVNMWAAKLRVKVCRAKDVKSGKYFVKTRLGLDSFQTNKNEKADPNPEWQSVFVLTPYNITDIFRCELCSPKVTGAKAIGSIQLSMAELLQKIPEGKPWENTFSFPGVQGAQSNPSLVLELSWCVTVGPNKAPFIKPQPAGSSEEAPMFEVMVYDPSSTKGASNQVLTIDSKRHKVMGHLNVKKKNPPAGLQLHITELCGINMEGEGRVSLVVGGEEGNFVTHNLFIGQDREFIHALRMNALMMGFISFKCFELRVPESHLDPLPQPPPDRQTGGWLHMLAGFLTRFTEQTHEEATFDKVYKASAECYTTSNRCLTIENASAGEVSALSHALQRNTFFNALQLTGEDDVQANHHCTALPLVLQSSYLSACTLRRLGLDARFGAALAAALPSRVLPPCLCHLDLANNPLGNDGVRDVLSALKQTPCLSSLVIDNTGCNAEGLKQFGAISAAALTNLSLNHNDLSEASTYVSALLSKAHALEVFEAEGTNISIIQVVEVLSNCCSNIHTLNLTRNSCFYLPAQQRALCGYIGRAPLLSNLHIGGFPDLAAIFTALQNRKGAPMETLDLSNFTMDLPNLPEILPSIRSLNLSDCHLGHAGVERLVKHLTMHANKIEKLNLCNNVPLAPYCAHKSAAALAKYVATSPSLTELDLRATNPAFGWQVELVDVFRALEGQKRLKSLDFTGNAVTDIGLSELGQVMRKNRSLTALRFDGTGASAIGYSAFKKCLKGNTKLVDMTFPHQDISAYQNFAQAEIQKLLQAEQRARDDIKTACQPPRDLAGRSQAITELHHVKQQQGCVNKEVSRLESIVAEIERFKVRNISIKEKKAAARMSANADLLKKKACSKEARAASSKVKLTKRLLAAVTRRLRRIIAADETIGSRVKAVLTSSRSSAPNDGDVFSIACIINLSDLAKRAIGRHFFGQLWNYCVRTHSLEFALHHQQSKMHQKYLAGEPLAIRKKANQKQKFRPTKGVSFSYDGCSETNALTEFMQKQFQVDNAVATSTSSSLAAKNAPSFPQLPSFPAMPKWGEATLEQSLQGMHAAFAHAKQTKQVRLPKITVSDTEFKQDMEFTRSLVDMYAGDGIVDLYAGAGPRDLPDGGDCGDPGNMPVAMGSRTLSRLNAFQKLAEAKITQARTAREKGITYVKNRWRKLLSDTLSQFPLSPEMEYRKQVFFLQSKLPRNEGEITLVTQCSLDRLSQLKAQAIAWQGILSVAIYVPFALQSDNRLIETEYAKINDLFRQVDATSQCRLDIALLFEQEANSEDALYPINILRNLALEQTQTSLVFVLDVDFVPSANLHGSILNLYHTMEINAACSKLALVVPAFEVSTSAPVAVSSSDLSTHSNLAAAFHAGFVSGFHVDYFPKGHGPTDFGRWFELSEQDPPYSIRYEEGFEPYIITRKEGLPKFDTRFVGYGMNKIQWFYNLHHLGFSFAIAPSHFVVAHPHPRSSCWQSAYSSSCKVQHPFHHVKLKALYSMFKRELMASKQNRALSAHQVELHFDSN